MDNHVHKHVVSPLNAWPKKEAKQEMKYYVYISDTKVDMFYEQIPPRLRDKLATELKIDLKFLSVTFSQEAPEIKVLKGKTGVRLH